MLIDLQQVGVRVRRERERAGLSQRELADLTGLSQPTLARIELGSRSPNSTALPQVSVFRYAS